MKSFLHTIAWGLFLASSWTWCIGMYLPVVMLREYGWAGFLAFAVPNVLGCAAFGWIFTRARSEQWRSRGGVAMACFSAVTVSYHVFFLGFVTRGLFADGTEAAAGTAFLLILLLMGAALAISMAPPRSWPWLGAFVYCTSLLGFAIYLDPVGRTALASHAWAGVRPLAELPWLVPTLVFGFLLCPALDLSFHRARRESPSRLSFLVFGVTFAVMLLFTASYAPALADHVPSLIAAHLASQSLFTVAVHLRELRESRDRGEWSIPRSWIVVGVAAVVGIAAPLESNYLRFLAFYGLIFPAFVLFAARFPRGGPRWRMAILAVVLLLSLPIQELGFIEFRTPFLMIPLVAIAAVLLWPCKTDPLGSVARLRE